MSMKRLAGLKDDQTIQNLNLCEFCFLEPNKQILFVDEHTYTIPSVGSFVEGYILIIHQEHRDCFAEVPPEHIQGSKQQIRREMEHIYGNCIIYEHGRTGNCSQRRECKIDFHAHLHCLPADIDLSDRIAQDFRQIEVTTWSEIGELADSHPEYLYFESADGDLFFYPVDKRIESHYLRKRACEALELSSSYANWRDYPFEDNMQRTVRAFNRMNGVDLS